MNADKELMTLKMQVKAYQSKELWAGSIFKKLTTLLGLFLSALTYFQFFAQENIFVASLVLTLVTVVVSFVVNKLVFKIWKSRNE